tara:strand:+ start:112 stop:984 length:873 start_codon:yes stop_codon:yes gene_type:complete
MAMGAADVVPGVSGGTVAFITGIYEELLKSISSINFKNLRHLKNYNIKSVWNEINGNFLFSVFIGILVSVFSLSRAITYFIKTYPVLVWSLFFGLIISSAYIISKKVPNWNFQKITSYTIGVLIAYAITSLSPVENPESLLYIFLSGAIAICAMILPGISGSFILLLMGSYSLILKALNEFDILVITVFIFGCLLGLLSFAKLLNHLFGKYRDLTIAVLTGFLIGSLNKVWPWKVVISTRINSSGEIVPFMEKNTWPHYFEGDPNLIAAISLAVFGFIIVFFIDKISAKN